MNNYNTTLTYRCYSRSLHIFDRRIGFFFTKLEQFQSQSKKRQEALELKKSCQEIAVDADLAPLFSTPCLVQQDSLVLPRAKKSRSLFASSFFMHPLLIKFQLAVLLFFLRLMSCILGLLATIVAVCLFPILIILDIICFLFSYFVPGLSSVKE